jgi:REP element-mobilizing transposase RayT
MGAKNFVKGAQGANATTWSLSWQAIAGRDFLANTYLIERIRERLIRAHRAPGRQLLYFVLMPSEIHAIARIDSGESVASITRSFSHVLSRWVREAQTLRGPVFTGPCHGEPIESEAALRREIRMLAWRPVRRTSCKVATHYPHSALRVALGAKPGQGFDAGPLRALFGASKTEARAAIRSCIHKPPTDEEWRVWELMRGLELPVASVGSQAVKVVSRPVDAFAARLIVAGGSFRIDDALRLLEDWVIARINPGNCIDLHKGSGMSAVRGRALVACLAVSHRLCSAASVARHFDRAKGTLSEQMKACRSRPADRLILATPLPRILEESAALRASDGCHRHCACKQH